MSDPLGDGISSVELINHLGDDLTVVNAARVSYGKTSAVLNERDARLIKYLAGHNHWTPFAQPQIQFRYKMPLFVARQWFTHKEGFTRNEISARYVTVEQQFYLPHIWRHQSEASKQGSGADFAMAESQVFERWATLAAQYTLNIYNDMITDGVAGEMARMVLPQNTYTSFMETGSLAGYARLCHLRISPDAQQETRRYAEAVSELIEPLFPVAWKELRQ